MRWPPTARDRACLRGGSAFPLLAALPATLLGLRRLDAGQPYGRAADAQRIAAQRLRAAFDRLGAGERRQPAEARPVAGAAADEPGDACDRRPPRAATTATRGERPSVAKRGMPIPVMRDSIGSAAANSSRPMPIAINVSPSAPMLRKRPMPDPSAMAPASASGPPTFGRSSTTVSGRNATPSLRISTSAAAPSFCSSSLACRDQRIARALRSHARRRRCRRALHPRAAAPAALEPAASAAPAALICSAGGVLGILDAPASVLTPHLDGGADVLVPLEAFWLFSPAEHACCAPGRAWLVGSAPRRSARGCVANRGSDGTPTAAPSGNRPRSTVHRCATGRSSPTVTFLPNNSRTLRRKPY